jgi:hypothetical protein
MLVLAYPIKVLQQNEEMKSKSTKCSIFEESSTVATVKSKKVNTFNDHFVQLFIYNCTLMVIFVA